jgi:hypothetical protein
MAKDGDACMDNRIIRTKDGRVYRCKDCPYRNRETGFCGFCMRKILDEMKKNKEEGYGDVQTVARKR